MTEQFLQKGCIIAIMDKGKIMSIKFLLLFLVVVALNVVIFYVSGFDQIAYLIAACCGVTFWEMGRRLLNWETKTPVVDDPAFIFGSHPYGDIYKYHSMTRN